MTTPTAAGDRPAEQHTGVAETSGHGVANVLAYLVLGCLFGIVLIKSEVVSWFRIQEMFRFQAFHMYGILASAIATAALSIALLKRVGARTLAGEPISIPPKQLGWGIPILDRRRAVRRGMGAYRRLPRSVIRAHRQRYERLWCRDCQRRRRHVGLRLRAAPPPALLNPAAKAKTC